MKDLTGQRFGRLLVLGPTDERGPDGGIVYKCLCDCGNTCNVWNNRLIQKNHSRKRSCGCLQVECHTTKSHGMTDTILYHKWAGMKDRCLNPAAKNFIYYGGRGITVCNEWKNSFETFRDWALSHGYSEGLSLDRTDTNGNYCPENCRWIPLAEQQRNKRSNLMIEMDGERKTLAEWTRQYNLPYSRAWARIKVSGWTPEKALKTPLLQ